MPITPSCQPSPAATRIRSPRSSAPLRAISAAAARRIVSSTPWRSRLRASSCSASGWAAARDRASRRASARRGSPSPPAAAMRGARRSLKSDAPPGPGGAGTRLGSADSAADRDQQAGPTGGQRLDRLDRDSVAVLEATGKERLDLGVQQPQDLDREGRSADAVDVVIAVDDDRPAGG